MPTAKPSQTCAKALPNARCLVLGAKRQLSRMTIELVAIDQHDWPSRNYVLIFQRLICRALAPYMHHLQPPLSDESLRAQREKFPSLVSVNTFSAFNRALALH